MVGLPQGLKELAVLCLPSCIAERMSEEWQDHLNSIPGLRGQVKAAIGFVIAGFHLKLAALLSAAWSRISPKPTPEQMLAAFLACHHWWRTPQNLMFRLVTVPAELARERMLEFAIGSEDRLTETAALFRRLAAKEPDHPFIRSMEEITGRPIALRELLMEALFAIAQGQVAALRNLEIGLHTAASLADDRLNASQRVAASDAILAISKVLPSGSDENDIACATRRLVEEDETFNRVDTAIETLTTLPAS